MVSEIMVHFSQLSKTVVITTYYRIFYKFQRRLRNYINYYIFNGKLKDEAAPQVYLYCGYMYVIIINLLHIMLRFCRHINNIDL